MKKRTLSTVLATAILTIGIGVGAQVFADEETTNPLLDENRPFAQFSEVAPFMKERFPNLTEEQLEEWFTARQDRVGFMGPGMMRGGFGYGNAPEFSEVAPLLKEMYPDLTEEELEEFYNSRQNRAGYRGRGMGCGGYGFENAPEFSEVAPFLKEMHPDLTDEELEEWYNSRFSEDGFRGGRGPGMMRGGYGPGFGARF